MYKRQLLCLAVGGWGMILYFSTTNTLIQSSVSNAMRGRVMGIWALVFGGMMPLGGIESGFLSHAVGVPWTIADVYKRQVSTRAPRFFTINSTPATVSLHLASVIRQSSSVFSA